MNSISKRQLQLMVGNVVTAAMRADLITPQGPGLLLKGLLQLSSNALPPPVRDNAKRNYFGLQKRLSFPLDRWTICIRSDLLDDEAQKAHNLRGEPANQNMRSHVPLGAERQPFRLTEHRHEGKQIWPARMLLIPFFDN
jgi:hypothetical protein